MCVSVCLSVCSIMSDSVKLWTVAHQAPLSIGFSRQEYWSRLPFSPPEDLPNPKIKSTYMGSPALHADSLTAKPSGKPYFRDGGG